MNTAMLMVVARGPVASKRVFAVRARIHCHASRKAGNATTPIPTDKGSKPVWTLPCITSMRPPVSPYNAIKKPIRTRATVPMVPIWRRRVFSDSLTLRASGRREPGSYPVWADASARRQAPSDRRQGGVGLVDDLIQAPQGKSVYHLFAAALSVDETAVPQAVQGGADPPLRLAHSAHQRTNSA